MTYRVYAMEDGKELGTLATGATLDHAQAICVMLNNGWLRQGIEAHFVSE